MRKIFYATRSFGLTVAFRLSPHITAKGIARHVVPMDENGDLRVNYLLTSNDDDDPSIFLVVKKVGPQFNMYEFVDADQDLPV